MRRSASLLFLFLAACSDHPGPVTPPDELVATAVNAAFRIGDTLRIRAQLGGQTTTTPQISIDSQTPWLHDLPVLELIANGTAAVIRDAGRAQIRASAFSATSQPLSIVVTPARPIVLQVRAPATVTDSDTVVLRGYGMDAFAATALTATGGQVTVLGRDSANLRLRVAVPGSQVCSGSSSANVSLAIAGVDGSAHTLRVAGTSGALISLAAGELRMLDLATSCLKLPAIANAEYHLAFFDPRVVEGTQTAFVPAPLTDYSVTVRDRTVDGTAVRTAYGGRAHDRRPDITTPVRFSANALAPWAVGDTLTVFVVGGYHQLTVRKIYGDLVWAVRTSDSTRMAQVEARVDSAFQYLAGPGMALWDSVYGLPRPTSNPGTTQFLFTSAIVPADTAAGFATGGPERVDFPVVMGRTTDLNLVLLAHEYTHARDLFYHQNNGLSTIGWSAEGVANFLATETLRLRAGIAFDANDDWTRIWQGNQLSVSAPHYVFRIEPFNNAGELMNGYQEVAPLLRDLVTRVMRTGRTYYQSVREVGRAVAAGWYGCNIAGNCTAVGLAERLPQLLGAAGDPVTAVLTYTLSQSADDLTGNSQLQNLTYLRVGDRGDRGGFKAKAVIAGGSGLTQTVSMMFGSTGYFVITDNNVGGSYEVQSTEPHVRWAILRVK